MNTSATPQYAEAPIRMRLPAGGMSLVLHLLVLIGLALAFAAPRQSASIEADRQGSIVLAKRSGGETEYFDSQQDADSNASQPAAASATSGDLADALPPAARQTEKPLLEIDLPGGPAAVLPSGSGLVQTTDLAGGGRPTVLQGLGDAANLAEEAARRSHRGSGPQGPVVRMNLFGGPEVAGRTFVFCIDRSKSMGGAGLGALAASEVELMNALARLTPENRFQIIAYNQQITYFSGTKLIEATRENIEAAGVFLHELAAFGGTAHQDALLAALRMEPEVVFLMTDAGDPYLQPADIRRVTERTEGRASIHTIQFGNGSLQETGFMKILAERNRGHFGYVDMLQSIPGGG